MRCVDAVAELVKRPLYRARGAVGRWLSRLEAEQLFEIVLRLEEGSAEASYAGPNLLLELLRGVGFREVWCEDFDVGYEVALVNELLRKRVVITWECISVYVHYLRLRWEPLFVRHSLSWAQRMDPPSPGVDPA